MKTVALIPARAGSKGVPGKNIKILGGKPLIAWTIEAALNTPNIDRTFVTTEDEGYAEVAKKYGAEVLMRPPELAVDTGPETDEALLFALRQLQYAGNFPETLVLLQPTSPFRGWRDIERALELYYELDETYTIISGFRAKGYYWGMNEDDDYFPIMHDPLFRLPRQAYSEQDWLIKENGALYITSAQRFSEHRSYRVPPYYCYVMDEDVSLDIDTPEQWDMAVALMEKMKNTKARL